MTDFFLRNITEVYFFYGLSFFSMGLAVFVEIGHSSELDFARALRPLAAFGLIHGSHEWFEMLLLIHPEITSGSVGAWIAPLRLLLLGSSFLMLVAFGARLITGTSHTRTQWSMMLTVIALWGFGLIWVFGAQMNAQSRMVAADVYTRYSLAIPGAALTVWGLMLQRRRFIQAGMHSFGNDVALAALAFGLYGGIGQIFASPSAIFPSGYLNSEMFIRLFGFPVQVFRAAMACMAAVFIIRSLRAFEVENRRRIESLREAQLAERRRLEVLRAELLHRTVKAQEMERQRIARELHDESGQTLTALGLGLRGLSDTIATNPPKAIQQAHQLESLAVGGLEELQRLVSGLHPPQLDDLGLLAALRWYTGDVTQRYGLPITLTSQIEGPQCPSEVRVVLFRIAQEAITNIIRHANATQASVSLQQKSRTLTMRIEDNGRGFDTQATLSKEANRPHWGLLGMQERAALIGGQCRVTSQPGEGTFIEVQASWEEIQNG